MSTEGPVHDDEADRPLIELIERAGDDHRPPPGWQARVRARVATETRPAPELWWRRVAIGFAATTLVLASYTGYFFLKNQRELNAAAELRQALEHRRQEAQARREREFSMQIDSLLAEIEANQQAQDRAMEELRAARTEEERKLAEARFAELRSKGEATKSRLFDAKKKKSEDDKTIKNKCANSDDPLCGM